MIKYFSEEDMARRKTTPRFFIFLILFLGTIFSIVFFVEQSSKDTRIGSGSIEFRRYFDGVVIRDERIVEVDEFGKIDYHVAEGSNVIKGELVASAYQLSYNEKNVQDLIYVKQEIQDYQENVLLKGIVDVELNEINEKIEQKTNEVRQSVTGDTDVDLLQLERELESLMTEKEGHLKTAVKPDEKLNSLYFEKEQILMDINSWKTDMMAESSGAISFYFDGYEKQYNMRNLDAYKIEDLQAVLDGADVTDFYSENLSYPIYKLVNSTRWYISIISDRLIPEFNRNTFFTMIFDQNIEAQHTGELLGKRIFTNGYIYTFEFTEPIKQLLDARTVSIEMFNVFDGLIVPVDAIKYENGDEYLNLVRDRKVARIPISVATIKDEYAIIKEIKGYTPLKQGDKIRY
jgi:hypothetical protein